MLIGFIGLIKVVLIAWNPDSR